MPSPTAIVTCGPAYTPIDAVRRITNHSTGELGALLCRTLADAGFTVLCLRGVQATHPAPSGVEVRGFGTNADLREILEAVPPPDAIFHAAALCDFDVVSEAAGKIRSDTPELQIALRRAPKILPMLRPLFPGSLVVGWKYEVDGTAEEAIALGRHQIARANSDACVVNGPAYGAGLALVEPDRILPCATRDELCDRLTRWTIERLADRRA